MRTRSLVATLFLLLCTASARVAQADDRESLVGTWKITTFQDDGRDRLARLGADPKKEQVAQFVFTNDTCFIIRGDGRREMASGLTNAGFKSCSLDPTATPKSIDLIGFAGKQNEKTKTYLGIYTIDENRLSICYCEQGKTRPTKFESDGAMNLIQAELISKDPLSVPEHK